MIARTFIAGLGKATRCDAAKDHSPTPLRYVWHHILPEACGGRSTVGNTVQVCDGCHYGIHHLLWKLAKGGSLGRYGPTGRGRIAADGYQRALVAGTVGQIPNEG